MIVVVTGSRYWTDYDAIHGALKELIPALSLVIEGGARGADLLANRAAKALHIPVQTLKARWGEHGLAAGPRRNRQMLDMKPDLVLAFHHDLGVSSGTKDCVEEARRRGIPVRHIR